MFAADTSTFAAFTTSGVSVWEVQSGTQRGSYAASSQGTSSTRSPDLSKVLDVDSYGTVNVYDLASGDQLASASVPGATAWGAAFDVRDPELLVLGDDIDPSYWRLTPYSSEFASASTVQADHVIAAWSDGTVRMWGRDAPPGAGDALTGVDFGTDEYVLGLRSTPVATGWPA